MKQQLESTPQSQSGYITQSNQTRKQRIDKKRAIRKNKIQSHFCEYGKEEKQKVSKQQKVQLQKAKNREAAQRSRDQHKKYVQNLQDEIKMLKQQLEKPRYCLRCSKQLALQTTDSSDNSPIDLQMENSIPGVIKIQNNQEFQEYYNNDSSYIRIHQYEESSPLKMFLFIAMIVFGVFMVGDSFIDENVQINGNVRQLMELESPKYQFNKQIQIQNKQKDEQKFMDSQIHQTLKMNEIHNEMKKVDLMNHISNSFNSKNGQMTSIVPLTYEYSPLNQQNCLKSLIHKNYLVQTQPKFYENKEDKNLRQFSHNNKNHELEIFQNVLPYEKNQNNMLFCTLPKVYRQSQTVNSKGFGIFSKIIDIIVSGSEMMEIMGKLDLSDPSGSNLWMNRVTNFKGLYKINAQIKGIVQISDENCVL